MLALKGSACLRQRFDNFGIEIASLRDLLGRLEGMLERLKVTYSDMPTKPVGWYTDTFCV